MARDAQRIGVSIHSSGPFARHCSLLGQLCGFELARGLFTDTAGGPSGTKVASRTRKRVLDKDTGPRTTTCRDDRTTPAARRGRSVTRAALNDSHDSCCQVRGPKWRFLKHEAGRDATSHLHWLAELGWLVCAGVVRLRARASSRPRCSKDQAFRSGRRRRSRTAACGSPGRTCRQASPAGYNK